ncbi:MAG: hypothetical protein H7Y88_06790 [Phycisphaerales bacterium]|nr:hypothetical protein [Phycisphaerales bacterium]
MLPQPIDQFGPHFRSPHPPDSPPTRRRALNRQCAAPVRFEAFVRVVEPWRVKR